MSSDPIKRIAARIDRLTLELAEIKREVFDLESPGDIIEQLKRGELLLTAQAADVAEHNTDTAARWCNEKPSPIPARTIRRA